MWKFIVNVVLGFLNNFATSAIKDWFDQNEAEKAGKLEQQQQTESEANAKVIEVTKAVDAVKPLTADELHSHTKDNDADFRD